MVREYRSIERVFRVNIIVVHPLHTVGSNGGVFTIVRIREGVSLISSCELS